MNEMHYRPKMFKTQAISIANVYTHLFYLIQEIKKYQEDKIIQEVKNIQKVKKNQEDKIIQEVKKNQENKIIQEIKKY